MHAFLFLCCLLLWNGVTVSVQKEIQKLPDEEKASLVHIRTPQTLSRGWGDDIEWVQTYEEGLARSKHSKKPLMVIHHLEECPYSQALRKAFASSPEIQQMAQKDFIMLNLVHSSSDDNMAPDGHYVPRILFVDPSMTVRGDLTGKYGNRMYTYEPEDILTLIENMRQAKLLLHTEL
ncbi:anterior gradient protein 3-like [Pelecanus crispus]|uniref:anterior gradient protein 3-like n=1 Tax=Pelecanus crispus TaxID=36300 RepID=UPI003F5D1DFE